MMRCLPGGPLLSLSPSHAMIESQQRFYCIQGTVLLIFCFKFTHHFYLVVWNPLCHMGSYPSLNICLNNACSMKSSHRVSPDFLHISISLTTDLNFCSLSFLLSLIIHGLIYPVKIVYLVSRDHSLFFTLYIQNNGSKYLCNKTKRKKQ